MFLVKALLTVDGEGDLVEIDSKTATVSGTFGEDSELGTDTSNDTIVISEEVFFNFLRKYSN